MEHLSHIPDIFVKLFTLEYLPNLEDKVSLGLMFIFGLLTSLHCIAMCGGLVISGSLNKKGLTPNFIYNGGRIVSYTLIGLIAGGIGHTVNPSGILKGIIPFLGGCFMILLGIKALNLFPFLRRFNIRMPSFIAKKIITGKFNSNFIIGLLSGLMPCGPLQMIQLYAMGTKSAVIGAASSFVFALGTVPLLLSFGVLNSLVFKKHAKIISVLGASIVLALGVLMIGRGLALGGIDTGFPLNGKSGNVYAITGSFATEDARGETSVQIIDTELKAYEYPMIVVKRGIKVRWNLKASEENLNDCNNELIIPNMNIQKKLTPGDNIIEFTPLKTGDIVYTCWMGMIKSKIKVVD